MTVRLVDDSELARILPNCLEFELSVSERLALFEGHQLTVWLLDQRNHSLLRRDVLRQPGFRRAGLYCTAKHPAVAVVIEEAR